MALGDFIQAFKTSYILFFGEVRWNEKRFEMEQILRDKLLKFGHPLPTQLSILDFNYQKKEFGQCLMGFTMALLTGEIAIFEENSSTGRVRLDSNRCIEHREANIRYEIYDQ